MEGTLCFKPPQCDPNGLVLSLGDTSASRQNRARAYLAANCSLCHQPGGTASTSLDFRWEINNSQMNAINVPPRKR